jgi:glycyl-tRNA synthetase
MSNPTTFDNLVSLAKRRGFVFPGSQIYGGLANTYDFGPLGVQLLRNINNFWWQHFVSSRPNIFGLDTSIIMSPKVWEASGHTQSFTDVLIECKNCHQRTRADHVIEDHFAKKGQDLKVEGKKPEELSQILIDEKIKCPNCGISDWTSARQFNLLFQTQIGILPENKSTAFLRGEIAQGMFVNFKNILDTIHPKLPFGLAQSGKAFRNEITMGNFIFRTLEFNLNEFEYFFDPGQENWEQTFEYWKLEMWNFALTLGLKPENLRWRTHTDDERSHYSTKTEDLEYNFLNLGFKEMFGLAYRTDFDLKNHSQKSGVDLQYTDPYDPKHKFIPHVIEPTFGVNRILLAMLCESMTVEEQRTRLALPAAFAPYKVAVFPLLANKQQLVDKAKNLYAMLAPKMTVAWDDRGNIGKRYYAQDEIGTPYCVTVDFQTLEDNTVTVRNRDSAGQVRVEIDKLIDHLNQNN